jgi:hypothetical protein
VSNWAYVAIAYTVVWGSLAIYALILARRVAQARKVTQRLRDQSSVISPQSSVLGRQASAATDTGLETGD